MLDQPLDEFKPESGEAVPVGNHNLELISAVKPLQYGDESLSLPVEASGDVGDVLGVRVEFSHLGGLALEVSPLLRNTDAAITDHRGSCVPS